ncbi:THO complex subunit 1-like isoform X2 [Branchiostoma floridae x Branchiostoma belcheri]
MRGHVLLQDSEKMDYQNSVKKERERWSLQSLLSDVGMLRLAKQLGKEWKSLAIELGFTLAEIQRLQSDNPFSTEDSIFSMLVQWRRRQGASVNVSALAAALTAAGRKDLADSVLEHL